MRQALGILAAALAALLILPSLMLVFVQLRGFDFLDSAAVRVALPVQLGLAAILTIVSIALLRRGKKKS